MKKIIILVIFALASFLMVAANYPSTPSRFLGVGRTDIWVDLAGSDVSGTGTFANPYRTFAYACGTIANPTTNTTPYTVRAKSPGTYSESSGTLTVPANTILAGYGIGISRNTNKADYSGETIIDTNNTSISFSYVGGGLSNIHVIGGPTSAVWYNTVVWIGGGADSDHPNNVLMQNCKIEVASNANNTVPAVTFYGFANLFADGCYFVNSASGGTITTAFASKAGGENENLYCRDTSARYSKRINGETLTSGKGAIISSKDYPCTVDTNLGADPTFTVWAW